ncbi:MerR family DNA-binding transcriptional regulator [Streptomyces sioyaensis]|uniref:MerR family DNA-binding transcriptional regulator n=1 Tax=Streptomyces sioyaensis TaxID=67364 RepID=UPI001EF01C2A|nr:MerR family DNA-binding transcriptional regulator [Streptomyces sioyaensis]
MYEDGTGLLTIGALARLTGVPVKTIRNWSDQALLPPAPPRATGSTARTPRPAWRSCAACATWASARRRSGP